jgi:hypothetical protein
MNTAPRTVNWISARPLQHWLVEHLLGETDEQCGKMMEPDKPQMVK